MRVAKGTINIQLWLYDIYYKKDSKIKSEKNRDFDWEKKLYQNLFIISIYLIPFFIFEYKIHRYSISCLINLESSIWINFGDTMNITPKSYPLVDSTDLGSVSHFNGLLYNK